MTLVHTFARIDSWRSAEGALPVMPVLPSAEFDAQYFALLRSNTPNVCRTVSSASLPLALRKYPEILRGGRSGATGRKASGLYAHEVMMYARKDREEAEEVISEGCAVRCVWCAGAAQLFLIPRFGITFYVYRCSCGWRSR